MRPRVVIQFVQDEFNTAKELEDENPSLADEAGIPSWWVADVLVPTSIMAQPLRRIGLSGAQIGLKRPQMRF